MLKNKFSTILHILIYTIACFGILIFIQLQINKTIDKNQIILNKHWTVTINGETKENADLSDMFFSDIKKGEIIEISRILPDDAFRLSSISMLLRYSKLEVFVDNKLIESINSDNYTRKNLLGNGIVWIDLPENYQGKTLNMKFTFGEDNAFTSFDTISIVNTEQIQKMFVGGNLFSIVIISFLIVFGFFVILAGIILKKSDSRNTLLIILGIFSWSSSMWMFCNSRVSSILIDDFSISGNIEYCGLYMSYISMVYFLYMIIDYPFFKKAFKIWAYILTFVFVLLFILNISNVLHYPATVHPFQASGVITTFTGCVVLIKSLKDHKNTKTIRNLIFAFFLFLVFAILELIRYKYNHLVSPKIQLKQSFIPFGILAFIIFMFISFVGAMYEQIYKNIENKKLYDMAYYDHLTGLRNRAWCDKVMHVFEQESIPVSIINFDLDYFKEVNDTYGHLTGDELLKCFGQCLSKTFYNADCVARMGGDEFVVIIKYVPEEKLHQYIDELTSLINIENKKLKHGQIQFSVGISSSKNPKDLSIWNLYEQADQQMYVNKQERR